MKRLILFLLILGIGNKIFCQSAELNVMSSGGLANSQIAYTIGEPLINTLGTGATTITQGFHQTNLSIVGLDEEMDRIKISVYPNPTASTFMVSCTENIQDIYLQIIDSQGKEVAKVYPQQNQLIDVTYLAIGNYIIVAQNLQNQILSRHKLIKF